MSMKDSLKEISFNLLALSYNSKVTKNMIIKGDIQDMQDFLGVECFKEMPLNDFLKAHFTNRAIMKSESISTLFWPIKI